MKINALFLMYLYIDFTLFLVYFITIARNKKTATKQERTDITVNYKGMDRNFNYRLAEINYDEEKEQRLMDRIEQIMRIHGYEISQVTDGYASCEVDSMDEYKDFVREYKETKKAVKLWEKFGM